MIASPFAPAAVRHQHLIASLSERGSLRIAELPAELGVTAMTVWRDLKLLEEQGLIRRVRGGVLHSGGATGEPDYESKAGQFREVKRLIAQAAVREFVREGDVIAMEGGTTVAELVRALPESKISIVTNSLPIALQIRLNRPALPVRVLGGWLSPVSGNTTGPEVLKDIRKDSVSVCFLSATAWDADKGPMDPNPLEIEIKRALAAASRRVVALIDSRKFGLTSASVMIHPKRLHAVVSDKMPPTAIRNMLRKAGVRIVVAR